MRMVRNYERAVTANSRKPAYEHLLREELALIPPLRKRAE